MLWASIIGPILAGLTSGVAEPSPAVEADPLTRVRGMTVSCQTWGIEWGSDAFAAELDELAAIGVNWVAIHPYASIRADGEVRWRPLDPAAPPEWLARPIREAHARGLGILIKPHLAYWGSPFEWRGAIRFPAPRDRERFWRTYSEWIVGLARVCADADAFAIGTELAHLEADAERWRALAGAVRAETDAHLTYAANWDRFGEVTFWDALDCVGVQGYFPLEGEAAAGGRLPAAADLSAAWSGHFELLHAVHRRTGKPVVFTEVGFTRSRHAAARPWDPRREDSQEAVELQRRCLEATLRQNDASDEWFRGVFLWKCFPGASRSVDYALESPELRALIAERWREPGAGGR